MDKWMGITKVIPTFHPAYLMRGNQQYWSTVIRDLKLIKKEAEYPDIRKEELHYYVYDIGTTLPEELFDPENYVSFDIETPGTLKPWKGPVIGCSFSWAHGKAIHFDMTNPRSREVAKEILEGPAKKIVQRGTFDWYYLKYWGIEVANLASDTKIAQHLIAPNLPNSLAYLASVHTDINYYKPGHSGGGEYINKMSKAELAEYNNVDADATRRIHFDIIKELEAENLLPLYAMNVNLIKTLSKMQLRGIKVDMKAVNSEVEKIKEANDKFEAIFASKGINIRSSAQIGDLLASLGCDLKMTASGKQYKVDKEVLSNLEHPIAKKLLQFRELDKLRSTFLENMPSHLVNGRVHTTYEITGTITGRLSSKDPNLQNIPRRTRNIFIPDNGLFVEADYSQFELRVIAALITMWCNDETMEKDLNEGTNMHLLIGQECYHTETLTDQQLLRAKAAVFGTVYGRSHISLAREFKITNAEAEMIQHTILGRYPGIHKYHDYISRASEVRSAYGRIKQNPPGVSVNELYNFPVQSTAGETMKMSLIGVSDALAEPDALVLTVHDNLICDVNPLNQTNATYFIKSVMERAIPELEGRRFPCKIKTGVNWRDIE
jgi:DNA polymerase-1